jgi:hypothetical protein
LTPRSRDVITNRVERAAGDLVIDMGEDDWNLDIVEHGSTPSWSCPGGTCVCHPEERTTVHDLAILLHDADGNRMPGALCRIRSNGLVICDEATSDANGWVVVEVPTAQVTSLLVQWRSATTPTEAYHLRYRVRLGEGARVRTLNRIANLGFFGAPTAEENVRNACSLFDIAKGCTILQVWTHDIAWGSQRAWLKLYGRVFVVNSLVEPIGHDGRILPPVTAYKFDNVRASDGTFFSVSPSEGAPFGALMKMILDRTPLTHLVINAHGLPDPKTRSSFKVQSSLW